MKTLDLSKHLNYEIVKEENMDGYYYPIDYFPKDFIVKGNIKFNFNNLARKCVLCLNQHILIQQNNISAIGFAGATLLFAFQEQIKIIYEDNTIEYKTIKLDDMSDSTYNSIPWLFGKQKKDDLDFSHILYYKKKYIYHYVIKTNPNKTIKEIILPNNDLMFIFAITLLDKKDRFSF